MLGVFFMRGEAMVLLEIKFILANLVSKVDALAHLICNGNACLEAWLFAYLA